MGPVPMTDTENAVKGFVVVVIVALVVAVLVLLAVVLAETEPESASSISRRPAVSPPSSSIDPTVSAILAKARAGTLPTATPLVTEPSSVATPRPAPRHRVAPTLVPTLSASAEMKSLMRTGQRMLRSDCPHITFRCRVRNETNIQIEWACLGSGNRTIPGAGGVSTRETVLVTASHGTRMQGGHLCEIKMIASGHERRSPVIMRVECDDGHFDWWNSTYAEGNEYVRKAAAQWGF